jgi:hypothetical protein
MNIIQAIIAMILGQKYWANIINTRGTAKCEISCFIFDTREKADEHARSLDTNRSYGFVETISFRSRRQLTDKTSTPGQ